jgi:hypothetical protein
MCFLLKVVNFANVMSRFAILLQYCHHRDVVLSPSYCFRFQRIRAGPNGTPQSFVLLKTGINYFFFMWSELFEFLQQLRTVEKDLFLLHNHTRTFRSLCVSFRTFYSHLLIAVRTNGSCLDI